MKKQLFAVLFVASIGLTGCGNSISTDQAEPEAEVTFVSDFLKAFGYDTVHYDFSNIRTTEMTHPE